MTNRNHGMSFDHILDIGYYEVEMGTPETGNIVVKIPFISEKEVDEAIDYLKTIKTIFNDNK